MNDKVICDKCGLPDIRQRMYDPSNICQRTGDNRPCGGEMIFKKGDEVAPTTADFVLVLRSALQRAKFLIDTLISQDVCAPGLTAMQTDISAILSTATDERVKLYDAAPEMLATLKSVVIECEINDPWLICEEQVKTAIKKATV